MSILTAVYAMIPDILQKRLLLLWDNHGDGISMDRSFLTRISCWFEQNSNNKKQFVPTVPTLMTDLSFYYELPKECCVA